jgi:hypothetical protein
LAALAEHGVNETELRTAKVQIGLRWLGWPVSVVRRAALASTPRLLHPIGQSAGMARLFGLPDDYALRLATVTGADVQQVARVGLDPANAAWVALLPLR